MIRHGGGKRSVKGYSALLRYNICRDPLTSSVKQEKFEEDENENEK